MKIILVILYLILTISGLILMKMGGNSGEIAVKEGVFNFNISVISAIGFVCYICSFLLFTKIILMFDLSYIMPISTGIVQILTLVASYMIFKEEMTWQSVVGASVVIVGILLMNWKR